MRKSKKTDHPANAADQGGGPVRPSPRMARGAEFLRDAGAPEHIVSLAATGATDAEIADYLDLTPVVLCESFQKELQRGRASMCIGLRKKQIQAATTEDGDGRLLQFLGRHYLGQSDSTDQVGGAEPVKTYQNVRIEDV